MLILVRRTPQCRAGVPASCQAGASPEAISLLRLLRLPSRDRNGPQNHNNRIDRTKIICLWMRDVIREREKKQNDGEANSKLFVMLEHPPQSPESKNAQRRIDENVGRIERLIF